LATLGCLDDTFGVIRAVLGRKRPQNPKTRPGDPRFGIHFRRFWEGFWHQNRSQNVSKNDVHENVKNDRIATRSGAKKACKMCRIESRRVVILSLAIALHCMAWHYIASHRLRFYEKRCRRASQFYSKIYSQNRHRASCVASRRRCICFRIALHLHCICTDICVCICIRIRICIALHSHCICMASASHCIAFSSIFA
jgi:hypothetical protein